MSQTNPPPLYVTLLQRELRLRQQRNPSYSLRAFAKHLEIDPGSLSGVLNQRRILSYSAGKKVLSRLILSVEEAEQFLSSVHDTLTRCKIERLERNIDRHQAIRRNVDPPLVELPQLENVLRELSHSPNFQLDADWAAQLLGIKPERVREALARIANGDP